MQIPKVYDGRNRTFFFFNYEGFQQRRAATQNVTIPNGAWKSGDLSRNRRVGMLLAQGQALPDILKQLGHVAEGVHTVREAFQLAHKLGVDMPICTAVYRVLYEHVPAASAVEALLSRTPNSEF